VVVVGVVAVVVVIVALTLVGTVGNIQYCSEFRGAANRHGEEVHVAESCQGVHW